MRVLLIRHGATPGNLEGRYVGRTDEGLSAAGRAALHNRVYPAVERVAVSPMQRCIETARLIYPGHAQIVVPDFRECDFGDFEYKNYAELNGNPAYQSWIDSGGSLPFPGGESRETFSARCAAAFHALTRGLERESLAIVAHGGTIMAILAAFAFPKLDYFDGRVENGGFVSAEWNGETLTGIKRDGIV